MQKLHEEERNRWQDVNDQKQKLHEEEMFQWRNTYEEHVSEMMVTHTLDMSILNIDHESIQIAAEKTLNGIKSQLKQQQSIIEELDESHIAKDTSIAIMIKDHEDHEKLIQGSCDDKINKMNTLLNDYIGKLHGTNKCLMLRAARSKKSKVIQHLESILKNVNGDQPCGDGYV